MELLGVELYIRIVELFTLFIQTHNSEKGVKELQIEDAKELQKIRLQALIKYPYAFGASYEEESKWDVSVYEDRIRSKGMFYFGAFFDGMLVGMIALVVNVRPKIRHRAMVQAVYVDEMFQSRGIGGMLLVKAIEKACELKTIEQVELSVVTEQSAAFALYQKNGFEIYGKEYHAMKIGSRYYDEYLMVKLL